MKNNVVLKTMSILIITNIISLKANADAIWPFNTTYMMVKQLCNNSADVAERAANSRNKGYTLADMLAGYGDPGWNKDPVDRIHKKVYIRATKLAFKNKFISPEVIYDMQYNICYAQKKKYEKTFESLNK